MGVVTGFSFITKTHAGEISSGKKVLSKGRSTSRVVHENPIDHSLLNFAVSKHPKKGNRSRYVNIRILLGDQEQTISVNANSLAKRLNVDKQEIFAHCKANDLEDFINEMVKQRDEEIAEDFEASAPSGAIESDADDESSSSTSASSSASIAEDFDSNLTEGATEEDEKVPWPPSIGRQPLNTASQKFKAQLSDIIWAIGSLDIPKLGSLLKLSSSRLEKLSEARATKAYRKASKDVPAYRRFLRKQVRKTGVKPKTFDEVPEMDKENYIKKNSLKSTLVGGRLPKGGQIDTSTGTTGKPTVWVRSAKERALNRQIINRIRKEVIGDAIFINAYALGSLSTGLTVHNALVDKNLLYSPGPDCDKVLDMIEQFGEDGQQLVITGYPSFMSRLLDSAEAREMDLTEYNLIAVVGGEPISEVLRDRLTDDPGGFQKVISSYGASDLDINIGFETDFTVALRKKCLENPAVARELFGSKAGSPMVFQYNPLFYYVESNDKGQLLYTSTSGKKISPRIRYNSHDVGMVMTADELKKKLKKFNIDFDPPKTNFPFLFVWGREGLAASYYAAKVIPDELENAIDNIPELKDQVENFALHTYENDKGEKSLGFLIELKEDAELDMDEEHLEELNQAILDYIRENSIDFQRMDDIAIKNNGERPRLTIFRYGEGPMANQPAHKKKQYIYEGKDLLDKYEVT